MAVQVKMKLLQPNVKTWNWMGVIISPKSNNKYSFLLHICQRSVRRQREDETWWRSIREHECCCQWGNTCQIAAMRRVQRWAKRCLCGGELTAAAWINPPTDLVAHVFVYYLASTVCQWNPRTDSYFGGRFSSLQHWSQLSSPHRKLRDLL